MSRPLILLIVVILLLGGGMALLAGRATERAPTRVEKQVDIANLS